MKTYPSIPYYSEHLGKSCIAFCKYDGSNLRFSWSRKKGWHKFGTRRHLFGPEHPVYGCAVGLFREHLAEPIIEVITSHKDYRGVDEVTVFAEFFGPGSFAGEHVPGDKMDLVLFDVNPYKQGFVGPREFVRHFGHIPRTAQVVYEGEMDEEFVRHVVEGAFPVWEGVVAKGGRGHNLWMAKVKTARWIEAVQERGGDPDS